MINERMMSSFASCSSVNHIVQGHSLCSSQGTVTVNVSCIYWHSCLSLHVSGSTDFYATLGKTMTRMRKQTCSLLMDTIINCLLVDSHILQLSVLLKRTICHVISLNIKSSEACASHVPIINASLHFKVHAICNDL